MFRRFFIWRAEKQLGRSRYKLDRRHYRGIFGPGFFAHLSRSNFWQSDYDPYEKARRRKRRIGWVVVLVVVIGLGWLAIESSRALRFF